MRIPPEDDLRAAAEWLDGYEGEAETCDEDTAKSMSNVAEWLREQASKKMIRDHARAAKLPTWALRKAVNRRINEIDRKGQKR